MNEDKLPHGYDIGELKKSLNELNNTIDRSEKLLESNRFDEEGLKHLKKFINRCKLMRYRIKHRIDILEEDE